MTALLASFTHFYVGLRPHGQDVLDWQQAVDLAAENGFQTVLGVTWNATQLLSVDGTAIGPPVAS